HATFIAYHHTKHVWSKLNWLADLDAVFRHPDVDRAAVLAYAKSLRLEATVSAALELHHLAATGQHPSCLEKKSLGGELLQVCVDALPGDKELESELRRGWRMQALVFDWQGMPVPLWRRAWLEFCRFTPYYEDLRTLPGGSKLSYLRYSVALGMRLLRGAPRRIARMMQR
ncbi:MAG: nucleotidyltransferase family protein, partial [Actinobacteria bacterium]|nr:nucleotidyltransferase family protein [Actinomycetota bacterium]